MGATYALSKVICDLPATSLADNGIILRRPGRKVSIIRTQIASNVRQKRQANSVENVRHEPKATLRLLSLSKLEPVSPLSEPLPAGHAHLPTQGLKEDFGFS